MKIHIHLFSTIPWQQFADNCAKISAMARHESDREDLWAEAVALTSRVELSLPGEPQPVLVGYRDNGWLSVYFGQDVMLQFTREGELRRAYRDGDLFRTQGETLSRLRRRRADHETTLLRSDLSPNELAEFQSWTRAALDDLSRSISGGSVTVLREVNPSPEPLLDVIARSLNQILTATRFLAPPISIR